MDVCIIKLLKIKMESRKKVFSKQMMRKKEVIIYKKDLNNFYTIGTGKIITNKTIRIKNPHQNKQR